jgi:hypothetical protein
VSRPEPDRLVDNTPAAGFPSRLVRLAARALPAGISRNRYRDEFLAELHGMPRGRQMRHAGGILLHAGAMRTAVTTDHLTGDMDVITSTAVRMPLMCRLNLGHHWRARRNEDGERFRECTRCGKDEYHGNGPRDASGLGIIAGRP